MSGHSKWSSIKHKKGALDAKRGQLFTKLARDITMAARGGGSGDPSMNAPLRLAIARAKDNNMPNDNIERAIQRGTGGGDTDTLIEITYEGYGPGGTAVIVEAVTDNRNRTVAEVRAAFSRGGGNLGESGAVAWQFDTRGVITVEAKGTDPDEVQLTAIEAGALDISVDEDEVEVLTEPADLEAVREALTSSGLKVAQAEISRVPRTLISLDEKAAIQTLKLLERLDDLDDVSRVYSNADFPDEVLAAADA
ncbi:MAG: YebC/PmpR family DNA-binding transcriptional regulator [Dehalococcoidia bacterium]|nr:YebC/PmpR family DNA-binding transcriptional regulator [Dehalococcoidia bacterium]HRC61875.1 YebC/PmpR family DNA-binding transcriptional regulator [Dehalococcoidia bacterium]